jgi:proline dehydrogenase
MKIRAAPSRVFSCAQAYKNVPYGGVEEVLPYLVRRAEENSDVLAGVGQELGMLRAELKRRLLGGA